MPPLENALIRLFVLIILYLLLIAFAIASGFTMYGCDHSPPPPKPEPDKDVLVICVGGLGSDRTVPLADAIRANCPRAFVVSAGGWDGYKTDIRPIIAAYPKQRRVMAMHSYGCWWVTQPLEHFDYVMLLEPVNPGGNGYSWWSGSLPAPAYSARTEAYYRTRHDIERTATITGVSPIYVPGADHNSITTDAGVIAHVVKTINDL